MMFAVMGMIGSSGTILVDTFFVSHRLCPDGLAALNIAIAIFGLMNGLAMMIGIGGASRYTILKSQEHHHKANQTFTLSFAMALGMGILFFDWFIWFIMTCSMSRCESGHIIIMYNLFKNNFNVCTMFFA